MYFQKEHFIFNTNPLTEHDHPCALTCNRLSGYNDFQKRYPQKQKLSTKLTPSRKDERLNLMLT